MQDNQKDDRWYSTVATEAVAPNATAPHALGKTYDVTETYSTDEKRTGIINVLLVDDHALMREGLRRLLELEEDIQIIGEAVTRQITHEFPTMAVIMLTMHRQNQQVLRAMKNGARGYLLKSVSSQELAQAIRTVHEGGTLIEPELTGAIVSEYRRLSNSAAGGHPSRTLSEKELEIIRYVAAGMSNKEIAEKLAYSEKTVKHYLSIIFQKLGTRDRTQAAIFALRNGLIFNEEEES